MSLYLIWQDEQTLLELKYLLHLGQYLIDLVPESDPMQIKKPIITINTMRDRAISIPAIETNNHNK